MGCSTPPLTSPSGPTARPRTAPDRPQTRCTDVRYERVCAPGSSDESDDRDWLGSGRADVVGAGADDADVGRLLERLGAPPDDACHRKGWCEQLGREPA